MNDLITTLDGLGTATLGTLWIPLLLWTAGMALVAAVLRAGHRWHPAVRYRFAQATLLSLPLGVLLAACLRLEPLEVVTAVVPSLPLVTMGTESVEVAAAMPAAATQSMAPTFSSVVGLITVLALTVSGVALVRLLADLVSYVRLRRSVVRIPTESIRRTGGRRVEVYESEALTVPMTFGWRRPRIALPATLSESEKEMAIEHELVHIRQGDYLLAWIERLVSVAFAFHPAVHRLRATCALYREMGCDAAIIDERRAAPADYDRLLLRFSRPNGLHDGMPVAMADSTSNIHQRIRAMSKQTRFAFGPTTRWLVAATALVALVSVMVIPRAVTASGVGGPDEYPDLAVADTFVVVEQMPEPIGGLEGIQSHVVYDEEAREEGVEGTVFLQFVVSPDGTAGDIVVVRSIDSRLDQAAIEALRQTRFTPGRQSGEAVPVRMAIPVRFRLDGSTMQDLETPPPAPRPSEEPHASNDGTYVVVEAMPEPIGGLEGIQERAVYPEEAIRAGIEGIVFVQFVVDEDGSPSDIQVVRGIGGGADEAAVEAVRDTRFTPGLQRGEPVRVRMSLPIIFRLGDNGE